MPETRRAVKPALLLWSAFLTMHMQAICLTASDTLSVPYAGETPDTPHLPEQSWEHIPWQFLESLDSVPDPYPTRFRMLRSSRGIHVSIQGKDRMLTSAFKRDGEELYLGDVFEVFLHPEPSTPLYFEYEVNAHDRELVLLIPNLDGRLLGWLPWRYEGGRRVVKRVRTEAGGDGIMQAWSADLFIPFSLLSPLRNTPPVAGTVWHANVCRLDYDFGRMMKWSWSHVKRSFHEYGAFRPIRFE
jgi:hypothetical protein